MMMTYDYKIILVVLVVLIRPSGYVRREKVENQRVKRPHVVLLSHWGKDLEGTQLLS